MTQIRTTAALILLAAFAAIGGILASTGVATVAADRMVPAYVEVTPQMHRIDAIPVQDGTETLTDAQQDAAQAAADRVCEGWTAQVPLVTMIDAVAQEGGMSDAQARSWVHEVLTVHCGVAP